LGQNVRNLREGVWLTLIIIDIFVSRLLRLLDFTGARWHVQTGLATVVCTKVLHVHTKSSQPRDRRRPRSVAYPGRVYFLAVGEISARGYSDNARLTIRSTAKSPPDCLVLDLRASFPSRISRRHFSTTFRAGVGKLEEIGWTSLGSLDADEALTASRLLVLNFSGDKWRMGQNCSPGLPKTTFPTRNTLAFDQSNYSSRLVFPHISIVFSPTRNSAIRSADPENPTLDPNMKWIGWPVAEIMAIRNFPRGRSVVNTSTYLHWCHNK